MSLTQELEKMKKKADAAIEAYLATNTIRLQNYMRTHYKWTPKSGRAHQSMTAAYKKKDHEYIISLSYGVDYGVYLELAHEKKYAITKPTVDAKGPEIIKGFEGLLDRLK